ncbi:hypothetical protein PG993_012137 [Apiospora rasikravindrae]|uniref:FAD-binding PCMH-type domain-containing protein n=1 Tax=Apiospora rasikravindrae TaxID=990691 RepID=A0ABR1S1J0_9PEZI
MASKHFPASSCFSRLLLGFFFFYLIGFTTAAAVPRADLKALLTDPVRGWSKGTIVSFGGTSRFQEATERWTIFNPPTYVAAISPSTEEDVRKVIKLATTLKFPFLVTGKRHGYGIGLGRLHNGLAIDLSGIRTLDLNKAAQTITIGPGVGAGDIFDPLYEAGFELRMYIPSSYKILHILSIQLLTRPVIITETGSASCPSLIGVTLGGGVGRFNGVHGLLLDALVSVRMVTWDGRLITVSKTSYPDLFWAIRGAGANFGAVVSATYRVHPLRNNGDILSADFYFPANKSSEYFKAVEALSGKLPAEMASISLVLWNNDANETQVGANWVYLGPESEGRQALAPFLAIGPSYQNISVVKWNKLIATAGGGVEAQTCEDGLYRDLYSMNIKNYSASTYSASFAKMADFFARYPEARTSILQFEWFPNQAMAAVPLGETAWPWRDATGYVNPNMIWNKGASAATAKAASALGRELREDLRATDGYSGPSVFVNYARGDEKLEEIYTRQNLPRLARLKKQWDPHGFFSFNNALPTRYT